MTETDYALESIGVIRSELTSLADAPRQGDEGSYAAWLEFTPQVAAGLVGINVGDRLVILTWLHLAERDTLQVHPRDDMTRPLTGVFATRSSDRPNPIGLHEVSVLEIKEHRIKVAPIEAVDGTPIVDVKPVLKIVDNR
jgi:tRNA-Thr(GGU) m(6)t(6)A37 methyltransferase TsaA